MWLGFHILINIISGKRVNHKGRDRIFTNPVELEEERRRDEEDRKWQQQRGEVSNQDEAPEHQDRENDSENEDESSENEVCHFL